MNLEGIGNKITHRLNPFLVSQDISRGLFRGCRRPLLHRRHPQRDREGRQGRRPQLRREKPWRIQGKKPWIIQSKQKPWRI
jgi:hypothetical protein